jgi:hypothetical protein
VNGAVYRCKPGRRNTINVLAVVFNALLALRDIITALGLAMIMGVSIGAERTIRGRPADLRT